MSMILWLSGGISFDKMSPETEEAIKGIEDDFGDRVFEVYDDNIEFLHEEMYGNSSFEYVCDAIDKLSMIAKEDGIQLNGSFYIGSDCRDYDNVAVDFKDSEVSYANSEVRDATTEELIAELKRRGVLSEDFEIEDEPER